MMEYESIVIKVTLTEANEEVLEAFNEYINQLEEALKPKELPRTKERINRQIKWRKL